MGFWDKLFGGENYNSYERLRNTTPPPPPPMKTKYISEPVLSLVETIRNGEWESMGRAGDGARYFKHCWLGTEIYIYDVLSCKSCSEQWMTNVEKALVYDSFSVYAENLWKDKMAAEREKFMVFVNRDYNKEN